MTGGILGDVRLALRSLRATPVITVVAVASLALGIGTSTGIFTVLNSMALRPLPVANPDRLVTISSNTALGFGFQAGAGWSYAMWDRLRDRAAPFDGAFAWTRQRLDLAQGGEMQPVDVWFASGDALTTLGVTTIRGRGFSAADDIRGGGRDGAVGVISHQFWQRRFNGAESVLGSALPIEGVPITIIGITPPGFLGIDIGQGFDVAIPLGGEALIRGPQALVNNPRALLLTVMLRLDLNQSVAEATSVLRAMQADIVGADAPAFLTEPFVLVPASTGISDRSSLRQLYERPLVIIASVAGLVLLVVCVNIANVLTARAAAKRRELSVRMALGAARWPLARQFLVEGLALGTMGALGGMVFATWVSRLLVTQLEVSGAPVILPVTLDWRVLAFTVAVTLATVLVFGTAPALKGSRVAAIEALQDGRTVGSHRSLSSTLVIAQVAVSIVLMVVAGLMVGTLVRIARVPLGFEAERLLVLNVNTARAAIAPAARLDFYHAIVERLQSVPGVASAAASQWTPLSGGGGVLSDARGQRAATGERQVAFNFVTPRWFATYNTPVAAGRDIDITDHANAPRVALINETLRRAMFEERNPVGGTIEAGPCDEHGCVVIGVVADALYGRSLRDSAPPTVYLPLAQSAGLVPPNSRTIRISIRTAGEPGGIVSDLNAALGALDPGLTFTVQPLAADVAAAFAQERLLALLAAIFGLVAVLLSALGLYGVVAYSVTVRRPEIGVRLALGAGPRRVVRQILQQTAIPVVLGISLGVGTSLWLSRFVAPLLYGVEPRDPLTLVIAVITLATIGLAAAWIPASRAARIDPASALRLH